MNLKEIKKLPPAKGRRMSRPRSPSPSPSASKVTFEEWQKWMVTKLSKTFKIPPHMLSSPTDPVSAASTAASHASTPSTALTGKGDLRINGIPTTGEWKLELNRDYVDATTFGEVNKKYLAGMQTVDLTYDEQPRLPASDFDFDVANEMYEDDPVALAIIERLASMEREVAILHEEKVALAIKEKEARKARDESYKKMYDLKNAKRHITQWGGDDPVRNRRKSAKALRKGR